MDTDPLQRWREQLQDRAIPAPILESAPEDPWAYPAEVFRHRAESAAEAGTETGEPTPTSLRALEALPEGGSVLDVGCGGGATSLPLAKRAGFLVGVDAHAQILEAFGAAAARAGTQARTIQGSWPEAAAAPPTCDVAVCGHVLYNVQDLEPFVHALDEHALRRVVLELTERHPLHWMNPLWLHFHDVRFPDGPTAADARSALDALGFEVRRDERSGRRHRGGFTERGDALALVRRRLCLPADRDEELARELGEMLRRDADGLWSAGPAAQTVVTLWWDARGPQQPPAQEASNDVMET